MKSVLMPPLQMHRGYGAEFRKSKGETLQGVRTTRLTVAEEVAQKEWDQVGNQTVYQSGKEDAA